LFSAVWIWRRTEADLCLQFRDGGVEVASIVKTGRRSGIYANLFWSLEFIFAADACLMHIICFLPWFDVAAAVWMSLLHIVVCLFPAMV
jgi:hypothetical protein